MISISPARTPKDFETCAGLCRALGEWDVMHGKAYGISADMILGLYHGDTGDSLARKFSSPGARMFIASWSGVPAGCVGFSAFDGQASEIHKFYVDTAFRGKRIGHALLEAALEAIGQGTRRKALVHTTVYMKQAVALYEAFAFRRCAPFREIPDEVRHTEIFFSRSI